MTACPTAACALPPRIRTTEHARAACSGRSRWRRADGIASAACRWRGFFGPTWPVVWTLVKIVAIAIPLILGRGLPHACRAQGDRLDAGAHRPESRRAAGLAAAVRRRAQAAGQGNHRPVGREQVPVRPRADAVDRPALAAWAVMPFADELVLANIDAGLLYILAMTSIGVYGVIIAGWASNSKYAFLGCLRSAAQIVTYEIAMGFALVGVLMAAQSLNLGDIVRGQEGGYGVNWYIMPLFPLFLVYLISGVAETNRPPFDVAEGESEIVAGFHVEYSGMTFAVFFLAEYMNMILISTLCSIMFLGGWLSPLPLLIDAEIFGMHPLGDGFRLAVAQGLLGAVHLPVVSRDVSALPLRPDHAAGLEGVHPDHADLDRRSRRDDADAAGGILFH